MNVPNYQTIITSLLQKKFNRIGIFDSGIGGISLLKPLLHCTDLEIIYFADTANVPYGNRSQQEIQTLSYNAVTFLLNQGAQAIIIACHTASTNALTFLAQQFPTTPFIDVVELLLNQVPTTAQTIGILATQATTNSQIHKKKLQLSLPPTATIFTQACPQLASAIEEEYGNDAKIVPLVDLYLQPLLQENIDTLLLACTHYALIKATIQAHIGPSITLISAEQALEDLCNPPFFENKIQNLASVSWFTSGNKGEFQATVARLIPEN